MQFKGVQKRQGIWGVEAAYEEDPNLDDTNAGTSDPFTITATDTGLFFKGRSGFIYDEHDLQDLAQAISLAWARHMELKPKLSVNERGH